MKAFSARLGNRLTLGGSWLRTYRAIGACSLIISPWLSGLAQAEPGPLLSLTVTGQHRVTVGTAADNAVHVQLTVTPRGGSAVAANERESGSLGDDEAYRILPAQTDLDGNESPSSDVPLDPLEGEELLGELDAGSGARRSRVPPTHQEAAVSRAPFILAPAFTRQVIDAALLAEGVKTALGRLEGLGSRARMSAMLPDVRFRVGRDVDRSLRLAPTEEDPYRYTETGGVSLILEGSATFRLNRLLFASEELSIERLKLAQARECQRLTALVLDELVLWEQSYRVAQSGLPQASLRARMQLHESALRLDVLTNGWFSVHQPQAPVATPNPLETLPPQSKPALRPANGVIRGNSPKNTAEIWVEQGELEHLATSR